MDARNETRAGHGVDVQGHQVFDPTQNVLDLTKAANQRQDDLRAKDEKYVDMQHKNLAFIATLREQHAMVLRQLETARNDANLLHVTQMADLRAQHTHELILGESKRIDATGFTERISALERTAAEGLGKGVGMNQMWGYIVAAAGSGGVLAWLAAHFTK